MPSGSCPAVAGFIAAANTVSARDNAFEVSDWEDRQRATAWLTGHTMRGARITVGNRAFLLGVLLAVASRRRCRCNPIAPNVRYEKAWPLHLRIAGT